MNARQSVTADLPPSCMSSPQFDQFHDGRWFSSCSETCCWCLDSVRTNMEEGRITSGKKLIESLQQYVIFSCFKEEGIEDVSAKYQQFPNYLRWTQQVFPNTAGSRISSRQISYFLPREKHFCESQSNLEWEKGGNIQVIQEIHKEEKKLLDALISSNTAWNSFYHSLMWKTKSAAELQNKHADAPRSLPLREDSLLQNWLCRSLRAMGGIRWVCYYY